MASLGGRVGFAAMVCAWLTAAGFASCQKAETLGSPHSSTSSGTAGTGGEDLIPKDDGGPPGVDAAGLCGNQLHQIIFDAPNVYFVIDTSGSMSALAKGGSTRADIVHKAAVELVRDLGPLINVGAAVFPNAQDESEQCTAGHEVMPVTPGDAYTGSDGPTTNKFKHTTNVKPFGGTPTAATLEALGPVIKALPGKTLVLLVTDGGPNCNDKASCDGSGCGINIEGCSGDACCKPGGNCCAPGGPAGPGNCIDSDATVAAVAKYKASGLPLYVVGIPGSEAYSDVLKAMAIAAGTAQFAKPFYYAVDDIDNLQSVLGSIAAVAVSCIFTLDDPPKVEDETNVYLDGVVLPGGLNGGWRWMDPDLKRIELLGDACARLKAGQIKTVQIVSGCPTEPAK